ncbi:MULTISPECIES: hypothetical protein [Stenotrophomonas]|uniref:Uncharacterized protein n=1 Tax=Stenotrophomonas indicatrix TaxID=2045451 RepID=A0ABT8Q8B6_9GAMM|nr:MULTISPECIES: hypothetical protein [Stenotrophomonas]MDN8646930.1 hypothetical protein [Stenotrophomonas indicatrix]MDN8660633.1 hypothetical protein [Stenotrophomonas indicatrix]MDN8667786.1 hypothetical protein [Stenotrophomonas indicatrix]MDR6693082.1 hypothetical protein [Stenotrophomonas sp. 1337]WGV53889.1 hypothetical protein QIF44_16550 [Stenotrophomonas indicatrix]
MGSDVIDGDGACFSTDRFMAVFQGWIPLLRCMMTSAIADE